MVLRALALLLALVMPAVAGTWRWRDAEGRLHYSNVASEVPAAAEPFAVPDPVADESAADPGVVPTPPRQDRPLRKPDGASAFV